MARFACLKTKQLTQQFAGVLIAQLNNLKGSSLEINFLNRYLLCNRLRNANLVDLANRSTISKVKII